MAKGQKPAFKPAQGAAQKWADDARRAATLHRAGNFAEAAEAYRGLLKAQPKNPNVKHMLGLCMNSLDRLPEALGALQAAAAGLPKDANVATSLGQVLARMGRNDDAHAAFTRALKLQPDHPGARQGLTRLATATGDRDALSTLLADTPADAEAQISLGLAMIRGGEAPEAAVTHWVDAVRQGRLPLDRLIEPAAQAYLEQRLVESLALYQAIAAFQPSDAPTLCNIGAIQLDLRRNRDAVVTLQKALANDPNHLKTLLNLGAVHFNEKKFAEALSYYRRALTLSPSDPAALQGLINNSRHTCQWEETEAREAAFAALHARDAKVQSDPFVMLACHMTAADHLRMARRHADTFQVPERDRLPPAPLPPEGRALRIGYLSCDLHHHATAFLAVEMLERHDRARFETFAYSFGPDDGTAMRQRIVAAFDHFTEVGDMSDLEAARRIRADGIDILVDLKGYTKGCRPRILAYRPAAIQVNFLGYPGTMGADFVDYVIGDPVVTPLSAAGDYDEKIAQLPHTYQPNDSRRRVSDAAPTRADCGLPEDAFVFCCFNNTYKITPAVFHAWMRILEQVPNSVLWLFEANPAARDNLSYTAAAHGVDPDRLVFAAMMESEDHLARHRHADLFLDTRPYNAHTTASDALWAGVPVLTLPGDTFASRVAMSLLHAVGLPDLVTNSFPEYEALAVALAQDPVRLSALKAHLATVRHTAPLFDSVSYTHDIEALYTRMQDLRRAGRPPEALTP